MKIKMMERDKKIIARFLKYLACVVAFIFVVGGIVKHFSQGKNVENKTDAFLDEKKSADKKTKNDGGSWVDNVIASTDDEKKLVPVFEMSDAGNVTSGGSGKISAERKNFVELAQKYIGTPYKYGGSDKNGMDCSGFVYAVALDAGLGKIPKSAASLCEYADRVEKSDMLPGDLVFFIRDGKIYHVAVYLGDGKIIHSMSDGSVTGVAVSSLDEPYWSEHYYSSGKIFK